MLCGSFLENWPLNTFSASSLSKSVAYAGSKRNVLVRCVWQAMLARHQHSKRARRQGRFHQKVKHNESSTVVPREAQFAIYLLIGDRFLNRGKCDPFVGWMCSVAIDLRHLVVASVMQTNQLPLLVEDRTT